MVAQEVKALAGQTAKATEEIARKVSAIQNETGVSVAAIQKIADVMNEVEERAAATNEISSSVQVAANGTAQLATTVAEVENAISTTQSSAMAVGTASGSLAEQSGALAGQVREFLRSLREGPYDRRKREDANYAGPERRANA